MKTEYATFGCRHRADGRTQLLGSKFQFYSGRRLILVGIISLLLDIARRARIFLGRKKGVDEGRRNFVGLPPAGRTPSKSNLLSPALFHHMDVCIYLSSHMDLTSTASKT